MIKPQPKQEEFLTSEADIALYGGSAGGGKSFSLLLMPLYYISNSKFNTVFFRRTTVDIRNPGGLWDESQLIYRLAKGHPQQQVLKWTFESGANVKFAHLEHDNSVFSWQGSQINLLIFDELTHFSEQQFWYMLSRNRSTSGVKPRVRMSTNPDKDSWVRKLVDWWIGENGLPIQERSGVLRWFVRVDGKLKWADTKEELLEYGSPKSFTFIPAKLTDNHALMANDPGYAANLMAQNQVERAKLYDGNWNISYSDFGSILDRTDFLRYKANYNHLGEQVYPLMEKIYIVTDTASKVKEANDYSVIGVFGKTLVDQRYYILDWFRGKLLYPDLEQKAIDMYYKWLHLSPQGMWIEDKSTGEVLIQNLGAKGVPVFPLMPVKDKFMRLNDSLGIIKAKYVYLPENAPWVDNFIQECECFRADGKHVIMDGEIVGHDDQVDVLAYGTGNQITAVSIVKATAKLDRNKKRSAPAWMTM